MKTKHIITTIIATSLILEAAGSEQSAETTTIETQIKAQREKPVQHLQLPDITSVEVASKVMAETTTQLKSRKTLDADELAQIHIITYSLEKAIAYYAEHGNDEQKSVAEKMAIVVEEVHLNSENNRTEKTKKALNEYYALEAKFKK